jgi:general secretion pathway protein M
VNRLTPRERKLIALGILVAAIAALWLGLILPIAGGFAARAHERQDLLMSYRHGQRAMAGAAVWRAQAAVQRRDAGRWAILAPSSALASQALKQRLTGLIAAEGGQLKSVEDVQADVPQGQVRVRADLQLTMSQLTSSLKRLESEDNYVVIESVTVSADRAFQTGRAGPMEVRLELSAPWLAARAG